MQVNTHTHTETTTHTHSHQHTRKKNKGKKEVVLTTLKDYYSKGRSGRQCTSAAQSCLGS